MSGSSDRSLLVFREAFDRASYPRLIKRGVDSLDGTSISVMSEKKVLNSFHSMLTTVSVSCSGRYRVSSSQKTVRCHEGWRRLQSTVLIKGFVGLEMVLVRS